jgi:hypothetical protein
VGTLSDAPASAAKVVYQSWADSISSVTTPAGTFPGQLRQALQTNGVVEGSSAP